MEVTVVSAQGAPEGSILSIRAGGARRQGPINSKHPFRFPVAPTAGGPFKIDLLGPIATTRMVPRPDEDTYSTTFTTGDGKVITVDLNVQATGEGAAPAASDSMEPLKVAAESALDGATPNKASKRHNIALEARSYLDDHQLTNFIQSMLQGLLKEKPEDPYAWMARQLQGADRPNKPPPKPKPAPKAPEPAAAAAAPAPASAAAPAPTEPIPLTAKNSAFVFVKPHANTDAVNTVVKEQFAAQGIKIIKDGVIPGEEIDKKKLIDQHYYAIASKATILKPDQVVVPNDKFKAQFGIDWKDALSSGKAFNAMDACEYFGIDSAELGSVWIAAGEAKKVVKLGGGFYCGLLEVGGKSGYVLNAFFMSMRGKFTAPGTSIHYYSVEFDSRKLSWEDFRGQVLGPTDPTKAPAGSLRGKILASWEAFGLKGAPNTTDNGIHASASPFEGLAERMNWLGATPDDDDFGGQMLKAGISKETITAWSVDPRVKISDSAEGSLFDNLEDINADTCIEKCIALNKLGSAPAAAPAAAAPVPAPAPALDIGDIAKLKIKIGGDLLAAVRAGKLADALSKNPPKAKAAASAAPAAVAPPKAPTRDLPSLKAVACLALIATSKSGGLGAVLPAKK